MWILLEVAFKTSFHPLVNRDFPQGRWMQPKADPGVRGLRSFSGGDTMSTLEITMIGLAASMLVLTLVLATAGAI